MRPEVAHAARCHQIRRHCEGRRTGALQEVVRLLRKLEAPLPVDAVRALADLIDQGPARKTGPKLDRFAEASKRWRAAEALGDAWAQLGDVSQEEALETAAESLEVSAKTVWNLTRGPFLRVVECARTGGNLTDEECQRVNREFWAEFISRRKG